MTLHSTRYAPVLLASACLWSAAACGLDESGIEGTASSSQTSDASADGSFFDAAASDADSEGGRADASLDAPDGGACDPPKATCAPGCVDITSDPLNCGTCAAVCPGADASCAVSVCSATLRIRAFIDDHAEFVIAGADAYWHSVSGAAPGLWQNNDQPTFIDDVAWTPTWPGAGENRDCDCVSSHDQVTPLAAHAQTVGLTVTEQRSGGSVLITQQPSAANNDTLIVDFHDSAGGAAWYEVVLNYATH